ncbi:hypothetical protein V491_04747 [Pseudogymnoascus sp. VKM F-3775]|nr:hypothetical protein V491_04747 [Pseudogymnoascus sp. VKM F-3775]
MTKKGQLRRYVEIPCVRNFGNATSTPMILVNGRPVFAEQKKSSGYNVVHDEALLGTASLCSSASAPVNLKSRFPEKSPRIPGDRKRRERHSRPRSEAHFRWKGADRGEQNPKDRSSSDLSTVEILPLETVHTSYLGESSNGE